MSYTDSLAAAWRCITSGRTAAAARGLGTVALALGTAVAATPAAGAAPRSAGHATAGSGHWRIQPAPAPLTRQGGLSGDSCASAGACVAVGSYLGKSGVKLTLAEAWNGTAWSVRPTPSPAGATGSFLTGVSCTSPSACTAVGYYYDHSGVQLTLAEAWNGTAWSVQPTPNPSGGTLNSLSGVSCTAPDACTAVGSYRTGPNEETLAEAWNGTAWSIQQTPAVSGGGLSAVSCPAAATCTAVGSSNAGTLAEAWNGTAWSIQPTPNPSGGTENSLSGVSCTAPAACTAVGDYLTHLGAATLAEAWNGTAWSIQPTPNPPGGGHLAGVSCTTGPAACTAVGSYNVKPGVEATLAEAWNGTSWSIQPTPSPKNPGSSGSVLSGVSCVSASACMAAGSYSAALAEAWNGISWSVRPARTPASAANSRLSGVSCASATACVAVGYYLDAARVQHPLAEVWNGTAWSIERPPAPAGGGYLRGVSCVAARACTAVGSAAGSTLAEAWNGTAWSIQQTPNPQGSSLGAFLSGVSCTAPSACTAVGYYNNSSFQAFALAEAWDGTAWSIEKTPHLVPDNHVLNAVSCTSPSACTAVGSVGHDFLAEAWNGISWSVQKTQQLPSGAAVPNTLTGVSCPTPGACTAVGNTYEATVAQARSGATWSVQPTPSPRIYFYSQLGGVSCASASACTAVWSSGFRTVAGVWNGTSWSLQRTPSPAGSPRHVLSGVSCTSASTCVAVGFRINGFSFSLLVEAKR